MFEGGHMEEEGGHMARPYERGVNRRGGPCARPPTGGLKNQGSIVVGT